MDMGEKKEVENEEKDCQSEIGREEHERPTLDQAAAILRLIVLAATVTVAKGQDEDEGSESEVNTDRRSLAEHLEADGEDEYIRLEGEEYERYKTEMIEIDRGIEVYLIMKIREFKDMIEEDPGDEDLPEGLRTLKNLQRIIMVRGPEGRKMVIDHLRF